MVEKSNNWIAILYPENMVDNWQKIIASVLEMPMCYVIHDKDPHVEKLTGEIIDKVHVHLWLHYSGNTTRKHILNLCNLLSKPDKICCSTAQSVIYPITAYEYLIHNTEEARKDNKHIYSPDERVILNNFDIHFIAQTDAKQKALIVDDLTDFILDNKFTNYIDFLKAMKVKYKDDSMYFMVQKNEHSYFNTLLRDMYAKEKRKALRKLKIDGVEVSQLMPFL